MLWKSHWHSLKVTNHCSLSTSMIICVLYTKWQQLKLNHQPWHQWYSIQWFTQRHNTGRTRSVGWDTLFPHLTLNLSLHPPTPAIYLRCQPRAPSVPLPLTLRSVFFWNLRRSPQVRLLPVLVACNWISWVLGELLCLDSFGLPANNAYRVPPHLPMANTSLPLWLFIMMTRGENSSSLTCKLV